MDVVSWPAARRIGTAIGLIAACCFVPGCDANGGGASGTGGASGSSGTAGGTGRQYHEVSPNHFSISAASASGGAGSGSSGASGTGGTSGGPALPVCMLDVPSAPLPPVPFCGDGYRTGAEECDDGNMLAGDACSPSCLRTAQLVAQRTAPAAGELPLRPRELGGARHPAAAGCNAVGVTFVEHSNEAFHSSLALFSAVGRFSHTVSLGTSVAWPMPAVAALADDTFAVAWADLQADSDELGIKLAKVNPASSAALPVTFANASRLFSQRSPDIVFDGTEVVVAWVDDSDPVTGPDLRYRTFGADLQPLSADQDLAATGAVEDHVALAAWNGSWAAAWRSGTSGLETLEVQSGTIHWSIGPYKPGDADDIPALAFIDPTHLAVAFTMVEASEADQNTPHLHAAILDAAFPGAADSFAVTPRVEPYASDSSLSQTRPSVVAFPDRIWVGWRSEAVPGAALGEELWKREITWSLDGMGNLLVDASSTEAQLVPAAYRTGDQSDAVLLSATSWPEHRTFSVWNDWGKAFGGSSGVEDVALQVASIPKATCAAASLTYSPAAPVAVGTNVSVSAGGTCPSGQTASYRFAYAPTGSTSYVYLSSWGSASSAVWNTAGLSPGNYDLVVFVRTNDATDGYDDLKTATVAVSGPPPCSVDTISTSPSGPVPVGTVVSASATAHCPSGATPSYRFAYAPTGSSSYTYLTSWGASTSATWDTSLLSQADYDVVAFVRPSTATGAYEGLKAKLVGVRSKCTGGTLSFSGSLTLIGGATCSDPQFSYYYAPDDDPEAWVPLGTAWTSGTASMASPIPFGTYVMKVDVRELGFGTGDTTASGSHQFGPRCYEVSSPGDYTGGHPRPYGDPLDFESFASCDPGVTPEYSFWWAVPDGTYQLFPGTDWQSSGSVTLDTSSMPGTGQGATTYSVQVRVRGAGHVGLGEAQADGGFTMDDP